MIASNFLARLKMVGWVGASTLLLSNLVMLLSLGGSLLCILVRVYRTARHTPIQAPVATCYLVPGLRLAQGQLTAGFCGRLQRAYALFTQNPSAQVMVLGGDTEASGYSEAEAGRDYLVRLGMPIARISAECASRHTLENLRQARTLLAKSQSLTLVLVTSRHHLARCQMMASGLGLRVWLCAAEPTYQHSWAGWARLLKEAYLLHWYWVGRFWSERTNSA